MHILKMLALATTAGLLAGCNRNSDNAAAGGASDTRSQGYGQSSAAPLSSGLEGGSQADHEITIQIRHAITSDDEFSTQAKNVEVVTVNGKVTLRGPVNNVQEQRAIASIARRASGVMAVDNQLEVKATNQ